MPDKKKIKTAPVFNRTQREGFAPASFSKDPPSIERWRSEIDRRADKYKKIGKMK